MTVSPMSSHEGSEVSCRDPIRCSAVRHGRRFKAAQAAPPRRQVFESIADRERGPAALQVDLSCREKRVSGKACMSGFQAAGAMLTSKLIVSAAAS
jgi:hypothetical protein